MKRLWLILVSILAAVMILPLIAKVLLAVALFRPVPPPAQPALGYTGNWRGYNLSNEEERPLPPAREVWQDYTSWKPKTENGTRYYIAQLGGADRQSKFQTSTNSGDTPMGAQKYTHIEFVYNDPTNGTYLLSWSLRGTHDSRFLQFDGQFRLYQLHPYGEPGEYPPRLSISAIEGIKPGQ